MANKLCTVLFFLLSLCSVSSCNHYAVSINENPVYTPPPLYSGYQFIDQALNTCVKQTIADKNVIAANKLLELNCSHAGIQSLAGLEHFNALEKLNLANNEIADSAALSQLKQLKYLDLTGNEKLRCTD